MFSLKRPCSDCPFKKDGTMLKSLGRKRIEEILEDVLHSDGFFSCHKTVNYSEFRESLQEGEKFCAGALIAIEKANRGNANKNTRIAQYFGIYNPDELEDKEVVINPSDYIRVRES